MSATVGRYQAGLLPTWAEASKSKYTYGPRKCPHSADKQPRNSSIISRTSIIIQLFVALYHFLFHGCLFTLGSFAALISFALGSWFLLGRTRRPGSQSNCRRWIDALAQTKFGDIRVKFANANVGF